MLGQAPACSTLWCRIWCWLSPTCLSGPTKIVMHRNRIAKQWICPHMGIRPRPTVSCLHRRTRTVKQWTRVAGTNQRPESKRCPKLRVVRQWTVAGTNQRPESKRCPKLGAVRQWTVAETNQRPESKRCPKLGAVRQWTVAETSAKQTIVQNKRFVRAVPRAVPNLQIQPPKMPQHRKSSAKRQEVEVNAKPSGKRQEVEVNAKPSGKRQEVEVNAKPSGRRKAVRTRAQAKGRARVGQPARMLYRVWPAAWEPILHSHCCSVWD